MIINIFPVSHSLAAFFRVSLFFLVCFFFLYLLTGKKPHEHARTQRVTVCTVCAIILCALSSWYRTARAPPIDSTRRVRSDVCARPPLRRVALLLSLLLLLLLLFCTVVRAVQLVAYDRRQTRRIYNITIQRNNTRLYRRKWLRMFVGSCVSKYRITSTTITSVQACFYFYVFSRVPRYTRGFLPVFSTFRFTRPTLNTIKTFAFFLFSINSRSIRIFC